MENIWLLLYVGMWLGAFGIVAFAVMLVVGALVLSVGLGCAVVWDWIGGRKETRNVR